ncbi:Transporter [Sulfitobacter noctilucicola]|uniref:TRAP transporter 4TM/12TM fusion protein n=1 Tax=Sulfitobacter noctilucicola TaxID=1342301 RepID=A0A7W6M9N6_9RHOB|nr:TRAP transporter fused permease subunit [Sulfitobacter noctilucicola]KIN63465.1 Transporter [Sulfitobacter noctilucicola]MBB4175024.1 TRAP transporter 4TM/12TM fusion protein [Sulfitobacter noctilucicola]
MSDFSRPVLWVALGVLTCVFHLGLIFYGLVPNLVSRPLHMALLLPWVFLFAATGRWRIISGAVITVIGLGCCFWVAWNHQMLRNQYGFLESTGQVWIAVALLLIAIEGARRMIGWPLPIVALTALAYGLFGQYLPGEFGHSGTPLRSFLGTLTIAEGGLWGSLTGVSVSVVAIFVIFGAVLNAGEAGQGFMNVASAAAGRLKGGAAKVSVLSSALFGSISGSASANVASTGAITLPAMTKLGYPKRLAAAVEAVASSGGQIMPPLMGAGAFVMVELTGVPYTQIMIAAILPALLYFFAVWVGINAYAGRYDLRGVPEYERPGTRDVVITSAFFLIPFTVLLSAMFALGFTPQYAACLAVLAGIVALAFDGKQGLNLAQWPGRLADAAVNAGKQVAMIGSIIICASIIIGVLGITGLGVKLTSVILSGSGGMLWPALLLTALACLLLGMEVPTTAAYVICVSVAGPALIELGLEPLQAHLFVFWFALLSTITPPVCGAVFIAAGMIGENWLKVALTAMALGVGLYLIPLGMIANPRLIDLGGSPALALIATLRMALGLSLISYGLIGNATAGLRMALALMGLVVIFSGIWI